MRMRDKRIGTFLAAVAATAVLAGCSGGTDEVNGGTPATTTAAPAATTAAPGATAVTMPAADSGAGTGSQADGGGAAGVPRCTSAELTLTLGQGDAGAGSVYRPLVFTNKGSRTCELTGFPGVSYVAGDDGHQVGPAAVMNGPHGPEISMAPGRSSQAQVQFVQVANFDAAVCKPTAVRGLRVYPPGETASMFVPMEGMGCAGDPPGPQLSVQTMTAA
ncbi:hypothetical protein PSU4_03440 [Pseudonocardia sulfidoxydans NBRC 16205]|uniref:DUF4232 domain-containing protein n=2 Tax=Pseudonocardia sulfidoxydans TaxID=54011 RepID=A0A511D9A2_9PSEU|nr:DUF4232 domain-containing protein [Pseudonocardia sulfidoxydans]GEL21390.1 hypothetical protein PSU4_03440 [Pseudonocardia sulfidoxydans NBRC 16205]